MSDQTTSFTTFTNPYWIPPGHQWYVPFDVTSIRVQCWGPGGVPFWSYSSGGGGGGGEYFEAVLPVRAGYLIEIWQQDPDYNGYGSIVIQNNGNLALDCMGGGPGNRLNGGSNGGVGGWNAGQVYGDSSKVVSYPGGRGANKYDYTDYPHLLTGKSGAGGGGAGTLGPGSNAVKGTPGAGGSVDGGKGGYTGAPKGSNYGGGGGGDSGYWRGQAGQSKVSIIWNAGTNDLANIVTNFD